MWGTNMTVPAVQEALRWPHVERLTAVKLEKKDQ